MQGKIIATCGHEITVDEMFAEELAIRRSYSREGGRALSYESLCPECFRRDMAAGELFASEADAENWMRFPGDEDEERDDEELD